MRSKYTKIYLSFSPILVFEILKSKLFNKNFKLQKFYGIYLLTNNADKKIINNLKETKDSIYLSYYIIRLAYRFKRSKLPKSERIYYSLPFCDYTDLNLRYLVSIIDLIVRRYGIVNGNVDIFLNRLEDDYVNLFLKRYYKKKFNIDLKFVLLGKMIKPNKQIKFSFRLNKISSVFSLLNQIPLDKSKNFEQFKRKKILELTSLSLSKRPYRIPFKNKILKDKLISIDFKKICSYGLNKYESIIFLLFQNLKILFRADIKEIYKILKYKLLIDYLQISINKLFINNVSILLNKTEIEYLFCSHRSFAYENLIYKACRLSNIKSIAYDFSLGYPFDNIYKKEISLTTHPNTYIVNSNFRKEQYKKANQDYINSGNKLEIINCKSLQIEYARNNYRECKNINNSTQKILLSIFDNNYGENIGLSFKFTDKLAAILSNHRERFSCIVHSKINRLYLENVLLKKNIDIIKAPKGDFSLAKKSDLIISIGFQGSAIKTAFTFDKPLIFFTPDKSYFDNIIFSSNEINNKKTIKVFRRLIFTSLESNLLFSKSNNHREYLLIKELTNQFLELIGISNKTKNISEYLEELIK